LIGSLIPVENVYYLFCYAWNRFEEARTISTGAAESPDLPNLLAKVLLAGTRSLLSRGLDRGYLIQEEELSTIRGHIELGATLQLQARNARRVQCTFDELSHDLLHNRLLKASLRLLSKAQSLQPALARELQILAARIPRVSDVRLSAARFAGMARSSSSRPGSLRRDVRQRAVGSTRRRRMSSALITVENASGWASAREAASRLRHRRATYLA
jgi:5-methylcytosine-specific restriction endonuclease McrBC regulatory subunit McrC